MMYSGVRLRAAAISCNAAPAACPTIATSIRQLSDENSHTPGPAVRSLGFLLRQRMGGFILMTGLAWLSAGILGCHLLVADATAKSRHGGPSLNEEQQEASRLYHLGKYQEALDLATKVAAEAKERFGEADQNYAGVLSLMALCDVGLGRLADAEPLWRNALAIYEKALGPEDLKVATTLSNLGVMYWRAGRGAEAEPLFKRALSIQEKVLGPEHADVAYSVNNLAALYKDQARYVEAAPQFKRAVQIFEKALGPEHREVGTALSNLAVVDVNLGRYAEAEPLHRRALEIVEKALGPEHPDVATSLNNLADLYRRLGRYADAAPLYQRALAIWQKALGQNHVRVALALNNLATLYVDEGRGAAERGRTADAETRYKRALDSFERAQQIFEHSLGPNHPDVAYCLSNRAVLYRYLGRSAEAEPLLKRALEIRVAARGTDHPDVARSSNDLAEYYLGAGRFEEAATYQNRALEIWTKVLGPGHPEVAQSLNNLSKIELWRGNVGDSLQYSRRAVEVALALLGRDAGNGVGADIASIGRYLGQDLEVLARARGQGVAGEEAGTEAFQVAQWANQSGAASAVNQMAARFAVGADRLGSLVRQQQDLSGQFQSLDRKLLAEVSKPGGDRNAAREKDVRAKLADVGAQLDRLNVQIGSEFPDYAALTRPKPLTEEEVHTLLGPNEALVFVLVEDTMTHVFALTRERFVWRTVKLGSNALLTKIAAVRRGLDVDEFLKSVDAGKPDFFNLQTSYELYAMLLGSVDPVIRNKSRLIVVPTGPLTALPFHLLVTKKPAENVADMKDVGRYRDAAWLIKRQAVSVLPSVASLKALRVVSRQERAPKTLIAFANPVFSKPEGTTRGGAQPPVVQVAANVSGPIEFWRGAGVDRAMLSWLPALPDTATEVEAVGKMLGAPQSDIHLGTDASETSVKQARLSDYQVVYFATHGLVAGDIKGVAEPSLALTMPPRPSDLDDGLLTASEVSQLKLNADWVVLSACNTAAGEDQGAEALSGLVRAFFYAGARALMVSHWSVDSKAATRLTTSTFAALEADSGLGRADALRAAIGAYWNDRAEALNAYPAFWGPFSVVGEGASDRDLDAIVGQRPSPAPATDKPEQDLVGSTTHPSMIEPVAKIEPGVKMEPSIQIEQVAKVEPAAKIEPAAKVEPLVKVEPSVKVEPTAKIEPLVKVEAAIRAAEPAANIERLVKVEPTAKVEPAMKVEPTANAEPVGDVGALINRGELKVSKRDYKSAIEDFSSAIRGDPKNVGALNDRCWTRAVVGELDAALADCDRALKLLPNSPDVLDSRGFTLLKLGKADRAIADFDAALHISPKQASSLFGRGRAKLLRGDAAGAKADIEAAKAIKRDVAEEFASYGVK